MNQYVVTGPHELCWVEGPGGPLNIERHQEGMYRVISPTGGIVATYPGQPIAWKVATALTKIGDCTLVDQLVNGILCAHKECMQ